MGLKRFKPNTPGLRHRVSSDYAEITKVNPEKSLITMTLRGKGSGRNNQGRITVRHRGGGHKKLYRALDFKRKKRDVVAKVVAVEYDPNRTARIALLHYLDGDKSYILAPNGLKVGDTVVSSHQADVKIGNAMLLENVPIGTVLHNIEMKPGKGGQIARSAGTSVKMDGKENGYALLRLPSGEIRMILLSCMATVGEVGNAEHGNLVFGSAGAKRHLGWRPTVRGVAMNAHDHPHGGGRGRQKGYKRPTSPTGVPSKGYRTRKKNKITSSYIVTGRKR